MTEYTAEDFKNARFADHEDGRTAVRTQASQLWDLGGVRMGDPGMALDGWRPVVEARIMEHTLRDLRDDLALAREERDRLAQNLRRSYGQTKGDGTLTLDTLREAWENAEQSEDCRVGDVLIRLVDRVMYYVYEADIGSHSLMSERVRILHRAPQPEPWQALADVLGTNSGELIGEHHSITEVAKALHARGVRVTGGDDA